MTQHLGEFEQLIMFAVMRLGEDAYGMRIRQEIARRTERSVSSGAIYTALGRLEQRGFVSSAVADTAPARGGRRRKYYQVLPEGAAALQRAYTQVRDMAEGMLSELAAVAEAGDDE